MTARRGDPGCGPSFDTESLHIAHGIRSAGSQQAEVEAFRAELAAHTFDRQDEPKKTYLAAIAEGQSDEQAIEAVNGSHP